MIWTLRTSAVLLYLSVIVGCVENRSDPPKYATLEVITPDKVRLEIKDTHWTPLIGPNGFGGNKESVYYWATLEGPGPIYVNPELHENSPISNSHQSFGTITIDKINKTVSIELSRVLSNPNEPKRTEPNPANAICPIR